MAFSPCGQRLATAGLDRAVALSEAETGKVHLVLKGHTGCVLTVSFSANGERLASGGEDLSIRIWDTTTGLLLRTVKDEFRNVVCQVQFSPTDNRVVASVDDREIFDNRLKLWDADTGEMINCFRGTRFVRFPPDGRAIATCGDSWTPGPNSNRNMRLVNAQSGAVLFTLPGHTGLVRSASFSMDGGSKIASGSEDGTCKVWDSSTGALMHSFSLPWSVVSVWWGRDWVMDTQRAMAFAMGHHPRLGAVSWVQGLDVELVRMILDYTQGPH